MKMVSVRNSAPIAQTLVLVLIAFAVGVLLTAGMAVIVGWLTNDSRPGITLADVVRTDVPGFANAAVPTGDACLDRRGCVEGVVGDGVAIYRYQSLDLARQSAIYTDADFYRSDRFIIEFDGGLTPDERFQLIQTIEGTWTGSSD